MCSSDLKNLDLAFDGKELPKPKGDASKAAVDAVIKFAQEQGINSTPTILLPDGTMYQGKRDAETIKRVLEN